MYDRLLQILDSVGATRVLLVGDFMLDYYIYGNTDRISPEAPVVVMNVTDRQQQPGGAGSVVVDLAALGAQVACVGVVGRDTPGDQLRAGLAALAGVAVDGLLPVDDRPTTIKQRIIGLAQHRHRQQLMRIDEESTQPLCPADQQALARALDARLGWCDVVCLEDYNKGVLRGEFCRRVIQAARAAGKYVLVDPAAIHDYSRYAGAWLIKPNRRELALATDTEVNSLGEQAWHAAARLLADRWDIEKIVVTIDRQGAYLYERRPAGGPRESGELIPTRPRTVYDVTGAGDMVLAMLGLLVGGRYPDGRTPALADWVRLANFAGGLEVERFGSVGISRQEILAELARERRGQAGKLRTREQILQDVLWHRRQNHRLVFTNGCFDLLHPGHVRLLSFAKSQGDVLIVALNSDRSVQALKGPTRPILKQDERAALVGALEAVDYVTIFDELEPGEIIRLITPDVLVKGSDWTGQVVGQDWVEQHGGRVVLMPLCEGFSTTNLIAQVLQQHAPPTLRAEGTP